LFGAEGIKTKEAYRVIEAVILNTKESITFITNIEELDAVTITEYYRKRWDIEVFFKFIKQELNFSKFICRTENGIKVVLYSTLIAAILLLVYKKGNNLKGFKQAKQKFSQELEYEIMKQIIELSGGNPNNLPQILGFPPNK
jgi:IS4 transposase